MNDADGCWDAFGSDDDDEDDNDDCDDDDNFEVKENKRENNEEEEEEAENNIRNVVNDDTAKTKVRKRTLENVADATVLSITQHFVSLIKICGVAVKDRVVGIGHIEDRKLDTLDNVDEERSEDLVQLQAMLADRISTRGMKVATTTTTRTTTRTTTTATRSGDYRKQRENNQDPASLESSGTFLCDAAILLESPKSASSGDKLSAASIRQCLVPGGFLWILTFLRDNGHWRESIEALSDAVWDLSSAVLLTQNAHVQLLRVQKRSCLINAVSCPWMDKETLIPNPIGVTRHLQQRSNCFMDTSKDNEFHILNNESSYLQYERRVASLLTISPSVAERTQQLISIDDKSNIIKDTMKDTRVLATTILTDHNIQNATSILIKHGFVIIKGLLPPEQTIPWGVAVLSDFEKAVERLKSHPMRPVDLMNPSTTTAAATDNNNNNNNNDDDERRGTNERVFEPLSYKEMAMREDLRVDLRSGPSMETLRLVDNTRASQSMMEMNEGDGVVVQVNEMMLNDGPTTITANMMGTSVSWRFHPSIVAILKALFNPRQEEKMRDARFTTNNPSMDQVQIPLFRGNFGRWNFGGTGPNGSPQPFRIGQIGSVISCPGAADQAIHADTPHLYEHVDCLPCHYANVFTPGYQISKEQHGNNNNGVEKNEFDHDGNWTGNSSMGGTAFVHGSHRLSISAMLLSEDEGGDEMEIESTAAREGIPMLSCREMLRLRTIRPALDAGDVVIFDNRTLHYGLANTTNCKDGKEGGGNVYGGRRPMLYLNVTQSWFHDPKNWDDRESIFD